MENCKTASSLCDILAFPITGEPHMTDTTEGGTPATTSAPKDTLESQVQGHIQHAEEEAELAQKKTEALKAEAEKMKAQAAEREAPAPPEPGELSDHQKQLNYERAQVQVTQLAEPAVPRVVSEEVRLSMNTQQVADHLKNADPDMTGAVPKEEAPAEEPATEGTPAPAPAPEEQPAA